MILSHSDYLFYLRQDKIALGIQDGFTNKVKRFWISHEIWEFQKSLRKAEYYKNCRKDLLGKIVYLFVKKRLNKQSILLGFSIPENVFGPGLCIVHRGTIVVNANAKVGKNCRIHVCTNIGASGGLKLAPQIGNNVYIAPGVKIYGNIQVKDNIAFAANAAVNKDCLESNSIYGGVPAKRIGEIEISKLISHISMETN